MWRGVCWWRQQVFFQRPDNSKDSWLSIGYSNCYSPSTNVIPSRCRKRLQCKNLNYFQKYLWLFLGWFSPKLGQICDGGVMFIFQTIQSYVQFTEFAFLENKVAFYSNQTLSHLIFMISLVNSSFCVSAV